MENYKLKLVGKRETIEEWLDLLPLERGIDVEEKKRDIHIFKLESRYST